MPEEKKYPELRAIRVTYSNGDVIETNMAANLTDSEMLSYFRVGRWFNLGHIEDDMQQVVSTEILR